MPVVVFYEKPGCLTNARQKALLERHGCTLIVRDLLSEAWTEARLAAFLAERPVPEWFNPSAPKIKSGEVIPAVLDRRSAMALLLREPLLIRRPLLETSAGKAAGFDNHALLATLGIGAADVEDQHRQCARADDVAGCPLPEAAP